MEATFDHAKRIASDIVRGLSPVSVILFGSIPKRGAGNDIDLLIITEDEPGNETRSFAEQLLKPHCNDFDIDYFVASEEKIIELLRCGEPFLTAIQKEGKTLYMKNFTEKWIQDSREDYDSALALLQCGYFKTACFHAHQATEKYIKARLLKEGWDLEKTHSIRRLVNYAKQYGMSFDIADEDISFIDSIYVSRYPASSGLLPHGDPTREDAERVVGIASRVTEFGTH